MKNHNPSYEPQMLGKVLVVLQNHENASDTWKPFSAAAGSDVFSRASKQVLTGSLWLVSLFSGCAHEEIPTAAEGAGGCCVISKVQCFSQHFCKRKQIQVKTQPINGQQKGANSGEWWARLWMCKKAAWRHVEISAWILVFCKRN